VVIVTEEEKILDNLKMRASFLEEAINEYIKTIPKSEDIRTHTDKEKRYVITEVQLMEEGLKLAALEINKRAKTLGLSINE